MKKLHYPIKEFKVTLNDGEEYIHCSQCDMRYSEPNDRLEDTYTSSEIGKFIDEWYCHVWQDWTWKFKKYIKFCDCSRKLLINNISSIEVYIKHRDVHESRSISWIGKELRYEEFLQFIFDKENELKSVLTSMSE